MVLTIRAAGALPTIAAWRILYRMVNDSSALSLDYVFSALADPTRRAIISRLASGDASVSELAAPFAMTLPAITKHLDVLRRAGLLADHKEGRTRWCGLRADRLIEIDRWLSDYRVLWEHQLDALETYLGLD